MNTEKLLRIADFFEGNPKALDMDTWIFGTTCCIAGAVVLDDAGALGPPGEDWDRIEHGMSDFAVQCCAASLLGLDTTQAAALFFWQNWPDEYAERFNSAGTPAEEAAVLVELLRAVVAGEVPLSPRAATPASELPAGSS